MDYAERDSVQFESTAIVYLSVLNAVVGVSGLAVVGCLLN